MMRLMHKIVLSLTLVAGAVATAQATEVGAGRNFGLGFEIGDPTGFTGKAFVGRGNAIDFGLAFGGYGYGRCRNAHGDWVYCDDRGYGHDWSIYGDYLWQDNLVHGEAKLDWHIGAGARIIFWNAFNDRYVGLIARMPLGLDLTFRRPDFLEVFFEIAPGIVLTHPDFDLDADLGVRFFF
jgi:hypothetical protein